MEAINEIQVSIWVRICLLYTSDPPIPHCTIGSYVGDLSTEAKEKGIYGNTYVESEEYDSDDDNRIEECVDTVYLSIGNRLFTAVSYTHLFLET